MDQLNTIDLHSCHKHMETLEKIQINTVGSPISKMFKVMMLMKEYDKKACRYQFCVKV